MTSASTITSADLKEVLSRYPALINSISADEKPAEQSLESLDRFRYIEAPASFSKQTGRVLEAEDVQQLMEWKLRHGKWRPSLTKLVSALTDEAIESATTAAFAHYASNPTDISGTIKLLAAPLKGIGPATASLLLSVHDPKNIVFFSDEVYKWLVADDKKIKYDVKEYEALHAKAQTLIKKLGITPIEVEKAAFVIIKESEPVREVKGPYVPSGKPRGRPALSESEKKKKPAPSGKPRGRPALPESEKKQKPAAGAGRGRPKSTAPKATKIVKANKVEKSVKPAKAPEAATTPVKKRGRPAASAAAITPPSAKKRGRPSSTATSTPATVPSGKKRGRPAAVKDDEPPSAKKSKKA